MRRSVEDGDHISAPPGRGKPVRRRRRVFADEFKVAVLERIERAERGQVRAILAEEGLNSSTVAAWRAAHSQGLLGAGAVRRGRPNRAPVRPEVN